MLPDQVMLINKYRVCFFFFPWPDQRNEMFWKWTWEIHLPQAQTPRSFPGKALCVHAARRWPGCI